MNKQLSLLADVPASVSEQSSTTKSVVEPAESSTTNPVVEPLNPHLKRYFSRFGGGKGRVNQYTAPKNGKNYFRYSYRKGNRIENKHIPGGNVTCRLAIQRADIIQQMVKRGASTPEILNMIDAFAKK